MTSGSSSDALRAPEGTAWREDQGERIELGQNTGTKSSQLGLADSGDTEAGHRTPSSIQRGAPRRLFDFVLAGDVLYKQSLLLPFLETVDTMMARDGRLLLCHVPRAGVTHQLVEEVLDRAGFSFRVPEHKRIMGDVAKGACEVGGIELSIDDARHARLYLVKRRPCS